MDGSIFYLGPTIGKRAYVPSTQDSHLRLLFTQIVSYHKRGKFSLMTMSSFTGRFEGLVQIDEVRMEVQRVS